ncbi:MAG: arginine--tRNA ligase [Planctomycetes bacterium]|nr:arginine--tRNA ligase [Planctomycetota bacterium]NOG55225.1 arginine--tRNA ligase [Planctomycetota bacterium]
MMQSHNDTTAKSGDPVAVLGQRIQQALAQVLGPEYADADPLVRPAQNKAFGDFQSNAAMGLGKKAGRQPRQLAQEIVDALDAGDLCEPPAIAGPGFINITIRPEALNAMLADMDQEHLGVEPLDRGHLVAVDMVGVNIAKAMHVGHLRSSIIGDSVCRILARLGYEPLPQNHLGDWGLQIGMLIDYVMQEQIDLDSLTLPDLEVAYRESNRRCKENPEALERAKARLVLLQQEQPAEIDAWHKVTRITLDACYEACDLMDLTLTRDHERGESFYRERLKPVVDALLERGIAEESEGAIIVRFPSENPSSDASGEDDEIDEEQSPLVIQKSDAGYLYATTDLAGIRYRVGELGAERLIYVVDARQRDHFKKVFTAAGMAGWDVLPGRDDSERKAELIHVAFGAVCGKDGKPLKTREGENVKLMDLLQEAVRRAQAIVQEKNPDLSDQEKAEVARAVGIGCVKYADLSSQLGKDYVFDWDRMLAFEGNTGAYLQNQYVRIRSIGRKAPDDVNPAAPFCIEKPHEKDLALTLLRYPTMLAGVGRTLEVNKLCQYLFDLAQTYSAFYTECPVLKAESPALRDARLRLCNLTAAVLADGLHLLGIRTLERM